MALSTSPSWSAEGPQDKKASPKGRKGDCMYVRMTFFRVRPGKIDELRNLYVNEVIPAHKGHKGIRFVHLLESLDNKDEGISITAWDTKGDLEAYQMSGDYQKLVDKFREQLASEPAFRAYEVTASSEPMILRIF
jgi:heme-degrading monooxygenase HmoA